MVTGRQEDRLSGQPTKCLPVSARWQQRLLRMCDVQRRTSRQEMREVWGCAGVLAQTKTSQSMLAWNLLWPGERWRT